MALYVIFLQALFTSISTPGLTTRLTNRESLTADTGNQSRADGFIDSKNRWLDIVTANKLDAFLKATGMIAVIGVAAVLKISINLATVNSR